MAFYDQIIDHTDFLISFTSNPKYNFGAFAQGYRFAANRVAERLIEKGNFPDYEACHVVFLYRHSFELNLNNIIYWSARLLTFKNMEDIEEKLYNTHNLVKLAENVKKVLTKVFPDDQELHKVIADIVCTAKEFSDIDPDSYSYRYPISTKGNYSTQPKQFVNL
jgi:hypothetical protein